MQLEEDAIGKAVQGQGGAAAGQGGGTRERRWPWSEERTAAVGDFSGAGGERGEGAAGEALHHASLCLHARLLLLEELPIGRLARYWAWPDNMQ